MSFYGIIHQSSCSYTPQQNKVIECKNRHLIEKICTLLLQNNVLICFWGDVIITTCYLINKMPYFILQHKVPYSIYFLTNPYMPLPLVYLVAFALFII